MTTYDVTAERTIEQQEPGELIGVEPEVAPLPTLVKRVTVTSDSLATGRITVVGGAGGNVNVPKLIVPYHRDRLRVTIKNMNASAGNAVYIGAGTGVTVDTGIRLDALDTLTLETRAPLWAICAGGESAIVGWLSEARQNDEQ